MLQRFVPACDGSQNGEPHGGQGDAGAQLQGDGCEGGHDQDDPHAVHGNSLQGKADRQLKCTLPLSLCVASKS